MTSFAANLGARPLCVDLDGTLIAADSLHESLLLLAWRRPAAALAAPFWLWADRAAGKRRISELVLPDPRTLPYRDEVLSFIREARSEGRPVYLVTAADQRVADAVAAHLGVFDDSFGSDGASNLKGPNKRRFLEQRFGAGGFDYLGDSAADVEIWQLAGRAFVVNGSPRTTARARAAGEVRELVRRPRLGWRPWLRALRPHQWAKNVLLVVPMFLAHVYDDPIAVFRVAVAFFAFSLCASSVYVANDLVDLESDRQHRSKRRRPLASGALSIPAGVLLAIAAVSGGLALASFLLPIGFVAMLGGYLILTTAYSAVLKQKLLADVVTLALLFTYRILAGGVAAGVDVSFWLLAFSLFFFTGLAFVKRYGELSEVAEKGIERVPGRNYGTSDRDVVRSLGTSCSIAAVLIMCLYINSPEVRDLYVREELLYLIAPVLLYWIGRVWFLAGRNELDDDPVIFALKDRNSLIAGLLVAIIVAGARFGF